MNYKVLLNELDKRSLLLLRIQSEGVCTHTTRISTGESKCNIIQSLYYPLERICRLSGSEENQANVTTTLRPALTPSLQAYGEWKVGGKQTVECILLCLHAINKMSCLHECATVFIALPLRLQWAQNVLVRYCNCKHIKYVLVEQYTVTIEQIVMPSLILAPDYASCAENSKLLHMATPSDFVSLPQTSSVKNSFLVLEARAPVGYIEWVIIRDLTHDNKEPTIGISVPLMPSFTPPDRNIVIEVSKRMCLGQQDDLRGWPIPNHANKIVYYNYMVRPVDNSRSECYACAEMRKMFGIVGNKRSADY